MKTLAPGFRASPTFDAIRSAFEPSTSYQTVEDELDEIVTEAGFSIEW